MCFLRKKELVKFVIVSCYKNISFTILDNEPRGDGALYNALPPCLLGMVPFAIGSETIGSMTYPAARCGVTAIRPTFGTVGRSGVMSISESLVVATSPFCFVSQLAFCIYSAFI